MARARNIKPGFFKNEDLAEIDPLGRLLFIGLWTLADRKGVLEDRPRKIKLELLPYDSFDPDKLLSDLADKKLISRFSIGGLNLIHVTNFSKHQNPHHTEKDSGLPELSPLLHGETPEIHGETTVNSPLLHGEYLADSLIHRFTDSLIPDSLIPDSEAKPAAAPQLAKVIEFSNDPSEEFDRMYRDHPIPGHKREARGTYQQLIASALNPELVHAGIVRAHAEHLEHWAGPGLNDWKPNFLQFFEDEWYLRKPREPTKRVLFPLISREEARRAELMKD